MLKLMYIEKSILYLVDSVNSMHFTFIEIVCRSTKKNYDLYCLIYIIYIQFIKHTV